MIRILLMTFAFIAVIIMNALANILPINGQATGEISNRVPVLFTPAGYAFSIWSVIYILLAVWIVGFWLRLKKGVYPSAQVTLFFVLSAIFNIVWLLCWHYEYFIWSIVAMLAYLLSLIALYLQYNNFESGFTERLPISVNLGWISVATIANISYVLTFYSWNGWGLSDQLWTVIMLTVATALALHIRFHHSDIPLTLVFIWAFIAIVVRHGMDELLVSTAALFLSGVLMTGILLIKKKPAKQDFTP
ncbi:tryptophan-rich sensory protein [Planococcus sp. ISL-109]|uniref:tryptophan-rich sensory protein n=1 Tax=Planococcus sp. ISL-109 TaxID=2819166 RepID=UPI001BEB0EDF|nr:tryptophan-rich sensory protein [Planococcus sp. ISL-109]MBT2584090.1 tryptophan-rich sensory protein [Planococcus sp. ISL-109]